MNVMAINGSPRKNWNTAMLLKNALEGAKSQGAETELVNLYDLNYNGCNSCFSCKLKDNSSYGECAVNDSLTEIFKRIEKSDALILGSPIYLGTISGVMKSFTERLLFPYLTYTNPPQSLFNKKINTGFIYTMNIPEENLAESGYQSHISMNQKLLELIFGYSETILSFDTYQFNDYSKVVADRFDEKNKAKRRKEIFPKDCAKAFDMGMRFAKKKLN